MVLTIFRAWWRAVRCTVVVDVPQNCAQMVRDGDCGFGMDCSRLSGCFALRFLVAWGDWLSFWVKHQYTAIGPQGANEPKAWIA